MESFNQNPESNQENSSEKMVEAIKISTIFPDQEVLEKIADQLLSEGTISGFHIDRVLGGYIFNGQKVKEDQYSLEILLDANADPEIKNRIKKMIKEEIGEQWEVPLIEEEKILVNEKLLYFIKRAEVEHKKFVHEKKLRLAFVTAALLSVAGMIGTFTKKYIESQEDKAASAERKIAYEKMNLLHQKIQSQITALDAQISAEKPLTVKPSDMSAETNYEETEKILLSIKEAEQEMRNLAEGKQ